jgi:hypothetical protein
VTDHDQQAAVDAWMAEEGMLPSAPAARIREESLTLDDERVLDLAFRAKNGDAIRSLYNGDTAKYDTDDSAADMALARYFAFYTRDPAQIERLMRTSRLVRRKWDERRGDGTYLTYTIGQVLKDQAEFYTPPAGRGTAPTVAGTARPPAATAAWTFLTAANLAAVDEDVHLDWVIRGLFARGHVTLMPGIWKSGKTTYITHAIKAVGEGLPFCGLDVKPGPVTVISEESKSPWRLRIASVGLGDYVDFLLRPFPKGRPTLDQWIALVDAVAAHAKDRALVVIDSIHNLWGVEQENDNAEQLRWLDPLHAITDAGAALLLAGHPSKAQQIEGRSTRGGGAIGGWADIIVEFKRYAPDDPQNRMRVLTNFSRFEETPLEMVVELADGIYRDAGTKADVRAAKRNDEMLRLLSDEWTTPESIHEAWPAERDVPSVKTIKRRLNLLVVDKQAERTGKGIKTDPYLYRRAAE